MKRIFPILVCMVLCLACTMLPALAADETALTATAPDISEKDYDETDFTRIIHELLGTYTPRTQTVTVTSSDGTTSVYSEVIPGLAGLDWEWIIGAVLFTVAMFCTLKMIGGALKWS